MGNKDKYYEILNIFKCNDIVILNTLIYIII